MWWTRYRTGEVSVCFSNEFSTFSHKLVYMDFQVGDEEPLPGIGEHLTAMTQVSLISKFKIRAHEKKVKNILEGCLGLIPSPLYSVKIQIMGGKITENLGFKSPLRKVKNFLSFFLFIFKFSIKNCRSLFLPFLNILF